MKSFPFMNFDTLVKCIKKPYAHLRGIFRFFMHTSGYINFPDGKALLLCWAGTFH